MIRVFSNWLLFVLRDVMDSFHTWDKLTVNACFTYNHQFAWLKSAVNNVSVSNNLDTNWIGPEINKILFEQEECSSRLHTAQQPMKH